MPKNTAFYTSKKGSLYSFSKLAFIFLMAASQLAFLAFPSGFVVADFNGSSQNIDGGTAEFSHGVLAVNTDQAVYAPGQNVLAQMGALDNTGHTLCKENLHLQILDSRQNQVAEFSTKEGTISNSSDCGDDNVTDKPDYFANFTAPAVGDYQLVLTNLNAGIQIRNTFSVQDNLPFTVKRVAATRINPFKSGYRVNLEITSQNGFTGQAEEIVQDGFAVSEYGSGELSRGQDKSGINFTKITWPVHLQAGGKINLSYNYSAPQISPDLFQIGFLQLRSAAFGETISGQAKNFTGGILFAEQRPWQIASDATKCTIVTFTEVGSLTANVTGPVSGKYIGGAFKATCNSASGSNAFTITKVGVTINNNNALSNMVIYTDTNASCNTANPSSTTLFGSNATVANNASTDVTGSVSIAASSVHCFYVYVDIGGTVTNGQTLTAKINAGTNITSGATVAGTYPLSITGTMTISNGLRVTGTLYSAEGGSALSGKTIKLLVNGSATTSTTTIANGTFSITPSAGYNSGDILTVYISGDTTKGVTVDRAPGNASSTGTDIYGGTLIARSNDGSAITNSDLSTADNNIPSTDLVYSMSGSNITLNSGIELHIWTGNTYSPGGTITTQGTGDLHVATSSTATLDTSGNTIARNIVVGNGGATLNINGDTTINGGVSVSGTGVVTTTANTPTVTFGGTGTLTSGSGTLTFYNLTTSGSGTLTVSATTTINNDLSVGSGTTINGTKNITVAGGDATGNGTVNMSGGTFEIRGTGNFGGTTAWTFNNLNIGNGATASTTAVNAATITVTSVLTIGSTSELNAGVKSFVFTDSGTPFVNSGIFTASTSLVSYSAVSASQNIATTTFNNLVIANTATGVAPASALTLTGNFTNNGTFTANQGTVNLDGATQSLNGTTTFYNLTISSGTTTIANAASATITVGSALSINSGSVLNASSSTISLTATGTPFVVNGTFTAASSTVNYQGSGTTTVAATTYYNLDLSPSSGSRTYYLTNTVSGGGTPTFTLATTTDDRQVNALAVDSVNGIIYAGSQQAKGLILKCTLSTDCSAGGNWTLATDTPDTQIYSFSIDTNNGAIYADGINLKGDIYKCILSTGCGPTNWTVATSSITTYDLAFDSANSAMYAGGSGIIYKCLVSTGCTGNNWAVATTTSGVSNVALAIDTTNNIIYDGNNSSNNIYWCALSTGCTSAGTWSAVVPSSTLANVNNLAFDSTHGAMYSIESSSIFRCLVSDDCSLNASWHYATTFVNGGGSGGKLYYNPVDTNIYAASDNNGSAYFCTTSNDCSISGNWSLATTTQETEIESFAVDSDNSKLYMGTKGTFNGKIFVANTPAPGTIQTGVNNNFTLNGAGNVTADAYTNTAAMTVSGNLTIGSGDTFSAASATTTIGGNLAINGTFTHNNGTVLFMPTATSTITSATSTSFYNLTIASPGKELRFGAASGGSPVFTIDGTFIASGSPNNLVILKSDSSGNQWIAHFNNPQNTVTYVFIKDSGCDITSQTADLTDGTSVDGTNNGACWRFFAVLHNQGGGFGGGATQATGGGSGGGTVIVGGGSGGGGGTNGGDGGGSSQGGGGSGGGSGGSP